MLDFANGSIRRGPDLLGSEPLSMPTVHGVSVRRTCPSWRTDAGSPKPEAGTVAHLKNSSTSIGAHRAPGPRVRGVTDA